MIETFRKIWRFAGDERKQINRSVAVSLLNAVLQMFQIGAIYLVVRALTGGAQGGKDGSSRFRYGMRAFPDAARSVRAR